MRSEDILRETLRMLDMKPEDVTSEIPQKLPEMGSEYGLWRCSFCGAEGVFECSHGTYCLPCLQSGIEAKLELVKKKTR